MTFPQLAQFADVALLFLRLMVGIVFITSGYKHLKDPAARSKDIGMGKSFTIVFGRGLVSGWTWSNFGRFRATRRDRFNSGYARRDPEENIRLAHGLLGQIRDEWLELRHDPCRNESGHRHQGRWKPHPH